MSQHGSSFTLVPAVSAVAFPTPRSSHPKGPKLKLCFLPASSSFCDTRNSTKSHPQAENITFFPCCNPPSSRSILFSVLQSLPAWQKQGTFLNNSRRRKPLGFGVPKRTPPRPSKTAQQPQRTSLEHTHFSLKSPPSTLGLAIGPHTPQHKDRLLKTLGHI